MSSRFRPYIVGIGGATKLQSSAEKALRYALSLAAAAGADTELFDGPSIHLPMYTAVEGERPADVRRLRGSLLFGEYVAICNWLGESGEIADFMDMANDYRARIGVDWCPTDGDAYIRELVELAKRTFGAT